MKRISTRELKEKFIHMKRFLNDGNMQNERYNNSVAIDVNIES